MHGDVAASLRRAQLRGVRTRSSTLSCGRERACESAVRSGDAVTVQSRADALRPGAAFHFRDQPVAKAGDLPAIADLRPGYEKVPERGRCGLRQDANETPGGEIVADQAGARERDAVPQES